MASLFWPRWIVMIWMTSQGTGTGRWRKGIQMFFLLKDENSRRKNQFSRAFTIVLRFASDMLSQCVIHQFVSLQAWCKVHVFQFTPPERSPWNCVLPFVSVFLDAGSLAMLAKIPRPLSLWDHLTSWRGPNKPGSKNQHHYRAWNPWKPRLPWSRGKMKRMWLNNVGG